VLEGFRPYLMEAPERFLVGGGDSVLRHARSMTTPRCRRQPPVVGLMV
jgi:hypothetical protein